EGGGGGGVGGGRRGRLEGGRKGLVEGERERTVERDVVVVVEPAEVGDLQMACERGGLRRDALHHATVAQDGVDVEVEEREAGPVVARTQPARSQRHPHRVRRALPEGTRGRLGAGGEAV